MAACLGDRVLLAPHLGTETPLRRPVRAAPRLRGPLLSKLVVPHLPFLLLKSSTGGGAGAVPLAAAAASGVGKGAGQGGGGVLVQRGEGEQAGQQASPGPPSSGGRCGGSQCPAQRLCGLRRWR